MTTLSTNYDVIYFRLLKFMRSSNTIWMQVQVANILLMHLSDGTPAHIRIYTLYF